MPYLKARDVTFLQLRDAVLCVSCELISYNNSPRCLACGSEAVLSLARTLGGSLGSTSARLSAEELVRVAGEVLRPNAGDAPGNWSITPAPALAVSATTSFIPAAERGLRRVCSLTGATAAAFALQLGGELRCVTRFGDAAPDLDSVVGSRGLTALCVRRQETQVCEDTEIHPTVQREACRRLGVRSIIVSPVVGSRELLGLVEIFAALPYAFTQRHLAAVELFAGWLALLLEARTAPRELQN